jgi:hypothetical protein
MIIREKEKVSQAGGEVMVLLRRHRKNINKNVLRTYN